VNERKRLELKKAIERILEASTFGYVHGEKMYKVPEAEINILREVYEAVKERL